VCREVRTSRAAALAAAIIVTAGVAGGYAVHRHDDASASAPITSPSPVPLPSTPAPRQPVLAELSATAPRPTIQGVGSELATASRAVSLSARLVGEVIDARTGARLWSRDASQPEPPASTTKLMTGVAALLALGPNGRLVTTTRQLGHTVYLVGGGDPTLIRDAASYVSPPYPQPATLADLARRTAAALGTTKRVRLRLDSSSWSGPAAAKGWKPSYVTEGDVTPPSSLELDEGRVHPRDEFAARTLTPAAQAGEAFTDLLRKDGVTVVGSPAAGTAGTTSTLLASVPSPPIAALVQRMLTVSDDDLAEALGRAVALHDHLPATFLGAGQAVTSRVDSLGVPTAGVSLQDTSGLSHLDRVTSRALVAVLRAATSATHPQLRSLLAGLPIAGLTGTLADRYLQKPTANAAGVLRAKTGTLTGVNALAGMVVDQSGRLLIFAFLASDAPSPGLTVPALDHLAARLAECGCT
jgi:D-alanyl-D-alanine carboxypeptidase/D-alanyl-D-alanine-endopeptidase (penicillin-binding protein 4)